MVVFMDSRFAAAQRSGMAVTWRGASALAGLEAGIGLVDDVDAPLAPHDAAVLVALLQRLQRIGDLHDRVLGKARNIGTRTRAVNPGQIGGAFLFNPAPELVPLRFLSPAQRSG